MAKHAGRNQVHSFRTFTQTDTEKDTEDQEYARQVIAKLEMAIQKHSAGEINWTGLQKSIRQAMK